MSSMLASSIPSSSFRNFSSSTSHGPQLSNLRFTLPFSQNSHSVPRLRVRVSASTPIPPNANHTHHPILHTLKNYARTVILIAGTAAIAGKFSYLPARAESPATIAEQTPIVDEERQRVEESSDQDHARDQDQSSPLSEFLESNSEAVESMKSLLQQKLESGEDEEALKILKRLIAAQPSVTEWKFLTARLLSEIGETESARNVFEEILAVNPLSFEALFENALLMDRIGEGDAVIKRLEEALKIAEDENKSKEARDVKLIIAQIQFLQKNVDDALKSYQELVKEDPNDFRPYFCQGMIYSLLDKNVEAKEHFAKYRELSPKKFEVDGYLRTPLSRMKLFGSD